MEWVDDLPTRETGPDFQDNPSPSWDVDVSNEAGAGFPAPASGYQGQGFPEFYYEEPDQAPTQPRVQEPIHSRPRDFDSILGNFSGASTQPHAVIPQQPPVAPKAKRAKAPKPAKAPKAPRPEKPSKAPKAPKPPKPPRAAKPTRAPRVARTSRGGTSWKRIAVPVGSVLAAAALVGGGVWGFNTFNSPAEPAAVSVPGVASEVSPGWARTTAWTAPADVASNLAVRNNYIAYLNSAGVLIVLDGQSGDTVFSSTPTGADPSNSRVVIAQIGDVPVSAVVQSTSITAWPLDADLPEAKVNDIPSSASVSSGGSGIMMIANGETWRMNNSLGMEKVSGLPEGNVSLGMTLDGAVVTGSPKGGWGVNDGTKTTPVKVEMAEGAEGEAMYPSRASKGIVVAWAPTADKETRAVGIYEAEKGTVLASVKMPTAQVNLGLPLVVSDGGKLASVGTWLFDLERGETEEVPGWGTTIGTATELHGKSQDGKLVWRGSGAPESVNGNAAVPWGVTSEDKAIVIINEGDGKVIAALDRG